jgi:hypothetical protein
MQSKAKTVDEYIAELPEDRQRAITELRKVIKKNLPKGFEERMGYGMMGWDVPHSIYPDGYHCNPKEPLPFMGLASQKNNISFYHMGLYADPDLLEWFQSEWPKYTSRKLDMGKSCVRFKKIDDIPTKLLGELAKKMTPKQWIELYEQQLKR